MDTTDIADQIAELLPPTQQEENAEEIERLARMASASIEIAMQAAAAWKHWPTLRKLEKARAALAECYRPEPPPTPTG